MSNLPSFKGLGSAFLGIVNTDAASQTLTLNDANKTLVVPGGLNEQTFTIPSPSEDNVGLWFEFAFAGDADTNENIIAVSSVGDGDIIVGGSTGVGTSPASTSEGSEWIRLLCITPNRYLVMGGIAPWVAISS